MIKLLRVDHRLLHGQVIYSWLKSEDIDSILVVDDKVANNETMKSGLRMVKPADKKLVMKSVEDSIEVINSGITDKYKLMVIIGSIDTLHKLLKGIEPIESVNLGGTLSTDNTKQFFSQLNLSEEDIGKLKEISEMGTEIEYRLVATDTKTVLNKKLGELV